jgi:orotate phosphoribosyltransferase
MEKISIKELKSQLLAILKTQAYFREKIILSSGKESYYYIDARRVTLSAQGAYLCGRMILEMVKGLSFDAIGGPTLGADPLVGAIAVLSYQDQKPVKTFIIRKAPKAHGKQQQVEGPLLPQGARVVIVDDVATTGKAFVQSIDVLKAMGIEVVKAICIVDRMEGASQAVAEKGCTLESIFKVTDLHQ